MRYPVYLLAISLFLLQGSTQDSFEDQLVGVWVQTEYSNKVFTFTRAERFDRHAPGIEFKAGGKLIKRQNVGWCGTPPITYGNNDGTWSTKDAATLNIAYQFWGGTNHAKWEVIELDEHTLKARILESVIEKEKKREAVKSSTPRY